MGLFDFLKYKVKVVKKKVEEKKVEEKKVEEKKVEQYYNSKEVTTIIRPRKNKSTFEDLLGNHVAGVKGSKKEICRIEDCYLGLKKFKKSERWVLLRKDEVDQYINDKEFIEKHLGEKSKQLKRFKNTKSELISEIDKDGNGVIDVIEGNDLMKLFRKHQSVIKEFDKDYVNHLVKISNYIKIKRSNIQSIFLEIRKTKKEYQLTEYVGLLKNQIHTYELLLFHSLSLINSIVQDDFITVNEIYEEFDKLKIFKSDHEREVSQQLTDIGEGLNNLMYSINSMERNIVNGLNNLSYVTEEGFSDLNDSLSKELDSINSSIKFNNLLTGIQSYQLYKINKNTKSLR